jgi:hypothetical protein
MAKIGNIELGGRGLGCGIAFQLSGPAPVSHLYIPAGEAWEIEMCEGQPNIVARTPNLLSRPDVLAQGLEQVQRCLDLLSFEKRLNLNVKRAGDEHIVLFSRNGDLVLQHVDVSPIAMGVSATVELRDKNGNVLPPNTDSPQVWTPGLRFYRLSQSNTDLYDAYRCLWLGLEALLDVICPKIPRERENEWLYRALSDVGNTIDLKQFVPASCTGCTDPVAYIVGTHYDHIRCRLFHAKIVATVSKADIPDPEEVSSAYEKLLRLWREIAIRCLAVHSGGGGAVTYVGFKLMLDSALRECLTMYFTDDPTPVKKEDTEVSPNGHPIFQFANVSYLSETAPGRVSFIGSHPLAGISELPEVHRICSRARDSLMTGWSTEQTLYLDGVDYLESHQTFRLINRDLPRVVFGEES